MRSHDHGRLDFENVLRKTAPPAAMTADYRQRVVRSSLAAREKVLDRRRRKNLIWSSVCAICAVLIPSWCLAIAIKPRTSLAADSGRVTLADSLRGSSHPAVDGYESAVIQAQFQSRVKNWMAAQRAGQRPFAE